MQNQSQNQQQSGQQYQTPFQLSQGDPEEAYRNKLAVTALIMLGIMFVSYVTPFLFRLIDPWFAYGMVGRLLLMLMFIARSVMILIYGIQQREMAFRIVIPVMAFLSICLSIIAFIVVRVPALNLPGLNP